MAIKRLVKEWNAGINDYQYSYVMDSADDFAKLPKSTVGSTAIVADKDGPIYMVNASGEWKEV